MKVKRLVGLSILLAVLCMVGLTPRAHADVNDFIINSFDADYTLTNLDNQGQLRIVEKIDVDFSSYNHGILRAIPNTYKNHRLQLRINGVSSTVGSPSQYTTYTQNDNTVLKIGDPNTTVTGHQEYTIDYTLRNVIGFYPDHDELYWDINGDQWAQLTTDVLLHLHLPEGLHLTEQQPLCFAGSAKYGCTISVNSMRHEILADTTLTLQPYQTLTVVAGFEKGYFKPSKWNETVGEYSHQIIAFAIPFVLLVGASGVYWYRRGRDPKGRGVIVPEYSAPDKLSPIEVGTLADFRTDNRDITATVIDLAVRGYIKIIEHKKDKAAGIKQDGYVLQLHKDDYAGLNEFEKALMSGLFAGSSMGDQVDLADLKYKLSKTAVKLRKDVSVSLLARDYFRSNPSFVTGGSLIGLVFGVFWLSVFVLSFVHVPGAVFLGILAGGVIAACFIYNSSSRTAKGVEAKEHILGLKMYMQVAEAQRIKMLQSPDAPYAVKTVGPARTVDLFEKLLPYAMVLGVEKQWAKKFENIYSTPPDWYSGGNLTAFNVLYLTSALSSGVGSQVNSAFSASSSSNSSGFGGGGFSGGGGGGGGGGGW